MVGHLSNAPISDLPVAIVGGGYAGMAAAVALAGAGRIVHVFDASRTLGGRARASRIGPLDVDNGQHILIGAYRDTLALMHRVGADPERLLQRLPLTLAYPGEVRIAAPRLPAPLHVAAALLGARGLSPADKWAAVRLIQAIKARNFRLPGHLTVTGLCDQARQTARVRRFLWDPLCISALNTPAERASANVFAHVLRDSLAAERQASDLLIPVVDLSHLFPEPAATHVEAHGGTLHRQTRIQHIAPVPAQPGQYLLDGRGPYGGVILAVAPHHLSPLIAPHPELAGIATQLARFEYEPIATLYLAYPAHVRLPAPMLGFCDGLLQWIFDRGQLGGPPGLLAGVISAHGEHETLENEVLGQRIHAELQARLGPLPPPHDVHVITEKRATFACVPGLARPDNLTPLPGLLLAGDYTASDYPATLESAVRSGLAAARHLG